MKRYSVQEAMEQFPDGISDRYFKKIAAENGCLRKIGKVCYLTQVDLEKLDRVLKCPSNYTEKKAAPTGMRKGQSKVNTLRKAHELLTSAKQKRCGLNGKPIYLVKE